MSDLRREALRKDEGLEIMIGLDEEGGGMEILALSAFVSVVPISAWRPFLLELDRSAEANERRWEALRNLCDC